MSDPYRGKPSLDDARARIARASDHIVGLKSVTAAVLQSRESNMAISVIPDANGIFSDTTHRDTIPAGIKLTLPPIVSILIGETAYNLKAALDYLIFELSLLNKERAPVTERTQFPIVDSEKNWAQREGDWIRALSDRHKAAIKGLQPFSGAAWTATLRDLHNPDKHSFLTYAAAETACGMTISNRTFDSRTGVTSETIHAEPVLPDGPVNVQALSAITLLFADRTPVIETLENLVRKVRGVIDGFDGDFQ